MTSQKTYAEACNDFDEIYNGSRRLTQVDRIVYIVSNHRIEFIQARYHYSDR